MIHLYINGESLDMKTSYKVTFSLLNPAFSEDAFPRVFSTHFKIPITPRNERILELQNRFDVPVNGNEYDCECYIEGVPFRSGVIIMEGHDSKNIEVFFKSDSIITIEDFEEKNIRDLLQGHTFTLPMSDLTHIYEFDLNKNSSTYHYKIVVGELCFERIYSNGTPGTTVLFDIISDFNSNFPTSVVSFSLGTFPNFNNSLTIDLTGFDFPKVSFDDFGTGLFISMTNATHGAIAVRDGWNQYLNSNPEAGTSDMRFPVIKNPSFYEEDNPRWFGYINYHSVSHKTNTQSEQDGGFQYNLVPQIRNGLIIETICEAIGFSPDGLYYESDFSKLFIYNTQAIDRLEWYHPDRFDTNKPDIDDELNSYQYIIQINEHIPDITTKEYLLLLSGFLNLFYIYQDGRLIITSRGNVLDTAPIDWTHKIHFNDYDSDINNLSGYLIEFPERENDDFMNDSIEYENTQSPAGFEVELTAHTLFYSIDLGDVPISGGNDRKWKIMEVNGTGNSEFKIGNGNEYGFRLFFYHGMANDQLGSQIATVRPYPYGSPDSLDIDGNSLGDTILDLSDKDESIYKKYWDQWIDFQNQNRLITNRATLSINDIISIDWRQPLRQINTSNGSYRMLLSKVDVTVSPQGITTSKISGYTKE